MGNMDDVYTLQVPGGVLVTSPLRAVSALVNEAAARMLAGGQLHPELDELAAALARPACVPEVMTGPVRPAFLGIIPTRGCDLSCVYCGFGAATAGRGQMPIETAVAAVDWLAGTAHRAGGSILEVHFFGGEPLAAPEVVDAAVHRARIVAEEYQLAPRLEISTNGLCSATRARFLGDYFDTVVLSLDGPRHWHDQTRPMGGRSSFDAVARTAEILAATTTELCVRACVTQSSVVELEEITEWFCTRFQPSVINLETLQPTAESAAAGLLPPDPYEFAAHCVNAIRLARDHGVDLVYSAAETGVARHSFCPVGQDTIIVSPDGRLSSCYLRAADWQRRGLDLDVGEIGSDGTVNVSMESIQRLRDMVSEPAARCAACFCRYWCAGGCHVNHGYPGCDTHFDAFCVQTRLITACGLLERLGASQCVDRLLADRDAMFLLGGGEAAVPAEHGGADGGGPLRDSAPLPGEPRAPGLTRYAVTTRGVIVFHDGLHRVLGDAEAALWALLAQGYSARHAAQLLTAVAGVDAPAAAALVQRCLCEWTREGLMVGDHG